MIEAERKNAQKRIFERAIHSSEANSDKAKERVNKLTKIALLIIRNNLFEKLEIKDKLLAVEIEGKIDSKGEEVISKLEEGFSFMQKTIEENSSMLKLIEDAENGNIEEIEKKINLLEDIISRNHPLKPDYCYKYSNKHFYSQPTSKEAEIKYPPRFVCNGELYLGGNRIETLNNHVLNQADRHQDNIVFVIKNSKKYLGIEEDPVQIEANELKGKLLIRKPTPFPPALICDIRIGTSDLFKRIPLRIEEIKDDYTTVLSNKEDTNSPYYFRIEGNIERKTIKFSMSIKNASNKEYLDYLKATNLASKGGRIQVIVSDSQSILCAGETDSFEYLTDFESIEKEIEFLERICIIEDFFNTKINLPDEIYKEDFECIIFVSDLIKGEIKQRKWNDLGLPCEINEGFLEDIKEMMGKDINLEIVNNYKANLFGEELCFSTLINLLSARLIDDNLVEKLGYMKEGEVIILDFVPGEKNTFCEKIQIEKINTDIVGNSIN